MGVVGADTEAERFMGAIWYGYPAKDLSDAKPCARYSTVTVPLQYRYSTVT